MAKVETRIQNSEAVVDAELVPATMHRQQPDWFDFGYQVLMLLVAVGILTMSILMRVQGENAVLLPGAVWPLPDSCMSRYWFGVDCPGCGLTRSFICMSQGEFARAAHFNFAGPLAYLFAVIQIPWRGWQLWRWKKFGEAFYSPWLFAAPIVVLCVLIAQWLLKLF